MKLSSTIELTLLIFAVASFLADANNLRHSLRGLSNEESASLTDEQTERGLTPYGWYTKTNKSYSTKSSKKHIFLKIGKQVKSYKAKYSKYGYYDSPSSSSESSESSYDGGYYSKSYKSYKYPKDYYDYSKSSKSYGYYSKSYKSYKYPKDYYDYSKSSKSYGYYDYSKSSKSYDYYDYSKSSKKYGYYGGGYYGKSYKSSKYGYYGKYSKKYFKRDRALVGLAVSGDNGVPNGALGPSEYETGQRDIGVVV